jgi:hypothetical protein
MSDFEWIDTLKYHITEGDTNALHDYLEARHFNETGETELPDDKFIEILEAIRQADEGSLTRDMDAAVLKKVKAEAKRMSENMLKEDQVHKTDLDLAADEALKQLNE